MKKLKLTVDALRVESFETADEEMEQRGTVHGNASDSTCIERRCQCFERTDWDVTCGTCGIEPTCDSACPTHFYCPTGYHYPGCGA